jgi:hypothetical protein
MSPVMRVAFVVLAVAVLAGVAWLSFQQEEPAAVVKPAAAPRPTPLIVEAVTSGPTSRITPSELPAHIPYDKITSYARDQNKIIYTMSSLNEPMEVHPDGLVIIRDHRMVVRYGDGREETRFVTLRARPKLSPPAVLADDLEPATTPRDPK